MKKDFNTAFVYTCTNHLIGYGQYACAIMHLDLYVRGRAYNSYTLIFHSIKSTLAIENRSQQLRTMTKNGMRFRLATSTEWLVGLGGSRAQVVSDSVWIYSIGRYIVVHVYVTVGVHCVVCLCTKPTRVPNRFSTLS